MSFDILVTFETLPETLSVLWEQEICAVGLQVEICPDFSVEQWSGGFLPFKLINAPENLIGLSMPNPGVSGFEVSFEDNAAHFLSAAPRPAPEFSMICIGAATLAKITNGKYVQLQSGQEFTGTTALQQALHEISNYLETIHPAECQHHPFPGWSALR